MAKRNKNKKVQRNSPAIKKTPMISSKIQGYLCIGLFLVLQLIILFWRAQYADFALDRDEGTYAYLGNLMMNGGTPYVDGFEMKPPGLFYIYGLMTSIFGYSAEGIHNSVSYSNFIGAIFIFFSFYIYKKPWAALTAGTVFSFMAFNPWMSGFAGVAEHFMNLFTAIGIFCLAAARKQNLLYLYALAGFAFAFSTGIKQNGAFLAVAATAYLLFRGFFVKLNRKELQMSLFSFIGGAILCIILILLPVIISGSMADMKFWIIDYPNEFYTESIPWSKGKEYLGIYFDRTTQFGTIFWITAILGLLLSMFSKISHLSKIGFVFLLGAAFLSIFPGLRFYGHYWLFLVPAIAMLNGVFIASLGMIEKVSVLKKITPLASVILLVAGIFLTKSKHENFFTNPKEFYVMRSIYGDNPFTELRILTDEIKKEMGDDDQVVVFGSEPQVYVELDKPALNASIFMSHLGRQHSKAKDMRTDFKQVVESAMPEYVVFVMHPFSWMMTPGTDGSTYNFAFDYVKRNYIPIGYADQIPNAAPKIVLGEDALTYTPEGSKYVIAFKRQQ